MMSRTKFFALALIVFASCSKSSDPAPAASPGCSVVLKGTTYALTSAVCTVTGAEQYLVGDNTASPTTTPRISMGKGTGVGDYLTFFTNSSDANTLYSSIGLVAPTITISGKTWTFSAAVANLANPLDTGTITGTCTCN